MSAMVSPDCQTGKHRACNGDSWDMEADAPAPCPCECGHLAEAFQPLNEFDISTVMFSAEERAAMKALSPPCATHSAAGPTHYSTPVTPAQGTLIATGLAGFNAGGVG